MTSDKLTEGLVADDRLDHRYGIFYSTQTLITEKMTSNFCREKNATVGLLIAILIFKRDDGAGKDPFRNRSLNKPRSTPHVRSPGVASIGYRAASDLI